PQSRAKPQKGRLSRYLARHLASDSRFRQEPRQGGVQPMHHLIARADRTRLDSTEADAKHRQPDATSADEAVMSPASPLRKPLDSGDAAAMAIEHSKMANAIRALAMDAVEQAKSGHPGLPMGAADIATVLFTRFMKFDPADPAWPDRDRFVLSAGHGSMLIYATLYLLGYEAMTI